MEDCLQTRPDSTPAMPSSSDTWEDDALDAEIERVEKLISSLFLERSKLRRKRNERRSPIYSLPQEILVLIFKFMCPPLDFWQIYGLDPSRTPDIPHPRIIGVLAAVSMRWHYVVSSTPSLWASFPADNHDKNAMKAIFSRSGHLPVIAGLRFPIYSELRKPHVAILAPILQEYASRVRMLHVCHVSPAWLKEHIPRFTNLELLSLNGVDGELDKSAVMAGTFTGLILKNVWGYTSSIPWSQIEVLHLSGMPVDDYLELLTKCTHLREYRLRDSIGSGPGEEEPPDSPLILPYLELFKLEICGGYPVLRATMRNIRMPALRTLVWNQYSDNFKPSSFLSTFFDHLPSTLSAVEVQNCGTRSNSSVSFHIMNLSSVERLTFKDCSGLFMDRAFSDLGSETCLVGNQVVPVLPKLKTIHVGRFHRSVDPANILKTFQRLRLQPLESPQGSPFRIEFSEHKVDWTPEFKEELIRMVEEGYKVELWEDSNPVDWLPSVKLPQK